MKFIYFATLFLLAAFTASALSCDSSTVSFHLLPGDYTCGQIFYALLSTTDTCPLSSGGISICNGFGTDCVTCSNITNTTCGLLFTCTAIGYNGIQLITATYSLGPLVGTIATTGNFKCLVSYNPPPVVNTPIPVQPDQCLASSVSINVNGIVLAGSIFTATLSTNSTAPGCTLSSGGAQLCNDIGRDCTQCITTGISPTLTYTCRAPPTPQQFVLTGTYLLGDVIGTIATNFRSIQP
ncbi:uncharacterized protein LOC126323742 [Schistocerca gregaria]|uniref:uncharacterized protein LOC126323742 n=1 Tax=Schistocerca gregaria TaxID=7010 RepID=UPI00211EF15F|nr:uncharacterized protein LOC126323742 [Schistocerca gregaria]